MKPLDKACERVNIDTSRRSIRFVIEGMIVTVGPDYLVDNIMGQTSSVNGFGHVVTRPRRSSLKEIKKVDVINAKGEVLPEIGVGGAPPRRLLPR
ncbi:MAG: hypothetical protein U0R19_02915 [Bryobacteraceae bacterium]